MSNVDWDSLYRDLTAEVGRSSECKLGVITVEMCEKFQHAVRGRPPEREANGRMVVPPLFIPSVIGWSSGPEEAELRPDGSDPADTAGLALAGRRLMGAGQSLEFMSPMLSGSEVTVSSVLDGVEQKSGRSGEFIVLSMVRRYVDEAGTELIRCHEKVFVR